MDKLIAAITKAPMSHKLGVVGFLCAGMIAGFYFLVYTEQNKEIEKLTRQHNDLEIDLQGKKNIANNRPKYEARVKFLQQKLEEKQKRLPNTASLDQLLRTLNELSEQSDMRIIKFMPLGENNKELYAEIPVKVDIEGNYHEIATFFNKISKEERIINISDIGFDKPTLKNGKMVLFCSCVAKTFKALPQRPQPLPGQ